MDVSIRRHAKASPPDLGALLEPSLEEGYGLVHRTLSDWAAGANRFDRAGEALFLAECDRGTVGMCGLNVDPFADEPDVGRIRHLYVLAAYRRHQVGRRLVAACIAAGRGVFDRLRLRTFDAGAARFYESIGFFRVEEESATHALSLQSGEEPRADSLRIPSRPAP
jgi:GNAT superfamily N-acetyltransferase